MISNRVLSIVFIVCCTACAPLVPLYQENHQLPKPLAILETSDVTINIQHLAYEDGNYVFDLEVINKTEAELTFAPQQVRYYASSKMFSTPIDNEDVHVKSGLNSLLTTNYLLAKSPKAVEARYVEREKNLAATRTFFNILSIGMMVYDVAQDAEDIKKESWTQTDANRAMARDALVASSLFVADATDLASARANENNYYSTFELFPDRPIKALSSQRGKIFFPIETDYRYVRLILPIDKVSYVIDFKRRSAKGR